MTKIRDSAQAPSWTLDSPATGSINCEPDQNTPSESDLSAGTMSLAHPPAEAGSYISQLEERLKILEGKLGDTNARKSKRSVSLA
jgi:hypothetical protein